ncbi:uncharacterized protein MYCFIDRAFT_172622 [Pseudocercospora fijiensis CIRAD86]|uniref:Uncharacterized protein n=1 Tax=Pseudocercospora fijiensis (strain CIRAD86) TaxID=383855 RepID=M3A770_PSEFD|nr:uncharacterized protein MYCFIDRAFT_172622 [Pseudocercospora fijiensis CIRAD86]EME86934.1 hypothetical protein MYCFIDRAFT_172622 [Pseudocercospora fijiensis CIRAD86]
MSRVSLPSCVIRQVSSVLGHSVEQQYHIPLPTDVREVSSNRSSLDPRRHSQIPASSSEHREEPTLHCLERWKEIPFDEPISTLFLAPDLGHLDEKPSSSREGCRFLDGLLRLLDRADLLPSWTAVLCIVYSPGSRIRPRLIGGDDEVLGVRLSGACHCCGTVALHNCEVVVSAISGEHPIGGKDAEKIATPSYPGEPPRPANTEETTRLPQQNLTLYLKV